MNGQITISGHQCDTLVEWLQDNADGEDVLITAQGDGSIVVAGTLSTATIDTAGEVDEA